MNTSNIIFNPMLLVIRWTARISSILFIIIFLLMFLGEGFEPSKVTVREWIGLILFPFGFVIGMLLAWWKEGLGGAIAVLSIFASLIVGGYSSSGARYMMICASPGFLFMLSWLLSREHRGSDSSGMQ